MNHCLLSSVEIVATLVGGETKRQRWLDGTIVSVWIGL